MKKKLTIIGIIAGLITLVGGSFATSHIVKHHNLKEIGTIVETFCDYYEENWSERTVRYEYKYNNVIKYDNNICEVNGTAIKVSRNIDNNTMKLYEFEFIVLYKNACDCHKTLCLSGCVKDYNCDLIDWNYIDHL